jgi:hypothetical protein
MSLALVAYAIRMDQGRADRRFLEWLKLDMELHATTSEMTSLVPQLQKMLELTDGDLAKINQVAQRRPGKATMLQHIAAPILDSRVSALWSFETDFQRQILEIKHHLSLLQDLVDRSRKYFDLTFTKLEGDNYRLVSENLVQTHDQYGKRAELVVDKIRAIMGPNR